MPIATRPLIPSIATGIGAMLFMVAGAPWWLTGMALCCFALAMAVLIIQSVFPQESEHRLAWWRDRRHHQQLRRHQPTLPGQTSGGERRRTRGNAGSDDGHGRA